MAIHEACGVFGVFSPKKGYRAAFAAYNGIVSLQHRGQDCCGICTFDGTAHRLHRGMGLVAQVFSRGDLDALPGNAAIGHVRYPTTGAIDERNSQPFNVAMKGGSYSFAFNGNIPNYPALRKRLLGKGTTFVSTTEIELIAMLFSTALKAAGADVFSAMRDVMGQLDGSYSIVFLDDAGNLYAARDPQGFKPLCMGEDADGNVFVSSESCALEALGVGEFRDVKPGEVVRISSAGAEGKQVVKSPVISHCMFEFLYFARGDSVIEGRLNHEVRYKLGQSLARMHPVKADFVVPVPDSGRSFALGYAKESGIPYEEGLMKNRYLFRTFIMPEQKQREEAVRAKLNPVRRIVEGKRIVLVEDSIVRGTTLGKIVSLLRGAGAKEVHVRVGCPPVVAPCYMGMDFPTYGELIAANNSVDGIRKKLGADSLGYTDLSALNEALGLEGKLCLACLNGVYPLKVPPPPRGKRAKAGAMPLQMECGC